MRALIFAVADAADKVTHMTCVVLIAVIFAVLLTVVVLRYVFGMGFLQLQEVATYAFAAFVVLGVPVAYRADAHVRVDILRNAMTPVTARRIDLAAFTLLVIPVFGVALWDVRMDIAYAWSIREGSLETGGLPGYFLVKTMLPVACVLMILQGLALMIKSFAGARDAR